jgi:hypothetical protein
VVTGASTQPVEDTSAKRTSLQAVLHAALTLALICALFTCLNFARGQVRPINPVKTPLPNAPHFKLYCMYGVGTPTERGYHYLKTRRNGATEWSINSMVNDPASGLVRGILNQHCEE